jgi:hypothetical protein
MSSDMLNTFKRVQSGKSHYNNDLSKHKILFIQNNPYFKHQNLFSFLSFFTKVQPWETKGMDTISNSLPESEV